MKIDRVGGGNTPKPLRNASPKSAQMNIRDKVTLGSKEEKDPPSKKMTNVSRSTMLNLMKNGLSLKEASKLLSKFGMTSDTILWDFNLGTYLGEPPVYLGKDQIFTQDYKGKYIAIDAKTGVINWQKKVDHSVPPIKTEDGSYFIVQYDWDGHLNILDHKTGLPLWSKDAVVPNMGHSPIYHEGKILVQTNDQDEHDLYAVDSKNGKIKWTADLNIRATEKATISPDGLIYVSGEEGICVLDPDSGKIYLRYATSETGTNDVSVSIPFNGNIQVKHTASKKRIGDATISGIPTTSASFSKDGKAMYIGTWNATLHAFDTQTGKLLWKSNFSKLGGNLNDPVVAPDGTVFISTLQKDVIHAFDPNTGKRKWTYGRHGSPILLTYPPTFDENGKMYIATSKSEVICLNVKDGKTLWRKKLLKEKNNNAGIFKPPVIGKDAIYVADREKGIFAISKDGKKILWNFEGTGKKEEKGYLYLRMSPTGILFGSSHEGKITAFKTQSYKEKEKKEK